MSLLTRKVGILRGCALNTCRSTNHVSFYHQNNLHKPLRGVLYHINTWRVSIHHRCDYTTNVPKQERSLVKDSRTIFQAGVASVLPTSMVKKTLRLEGDTLHIANKAFDIERGVYVVGFGKAVLGMVRATEDILGDKIIAGVASVPHGITETFKKMGKQDLIPSPQCKVKIIEGAADNIPDDAAFQAAREMELMLEKLREGDLVLTLISGGGSALLPYPTPPLTLDEMASVTKLLSRRGASIQQLNTVRKHLEVLKGGGLAKVADPAEMAVLILSDVVGDSLDFIASGPTVPDLTTPGQSLALIKELQVENEVPESVMSVLKAKEISFQAAHGGQGSGFPRDKVHNVLVGTIQMALEAAKAEAEKLGYLPVILTSSLSGDVEEATVFFTKLMRFMLTKMYGSKSLHDLDPQTLSSMELELLQAGIQKELVNELRVAVSRGKNSRTPVCVLVGGETTVQVKGQGLGGRNQHMALDVALDMDRIVEKSLLDYSPVFLSGGTDGQDGPTDAAGAIVDFDTVSKALEQGLVPELYSQKNDSHTFFSKFDGRSHHLVTGLTGTNVMDIQIILLSPNEDS